MTIEIRLDKVVTLLSELIRFPSFNPPGAEAELAHYLAERMMKIGCEVELQEIEPGRPNLIARLKGTGTGKDIILNTHLDVVPAGDGWSSDPFQLKHDGDKVYGRGVVDAKGALAAMVVAMETIALSGIKLKGDVILAAVIDEERASLGARNLPETLRGDLAVVGEATNGNLAIAHRGSIRPVLVAEGISAHSSTPHLGVNAISLMARALVALEEYGQDVLAKRIHPLTGNATLAATVIQGGLKESMIPDKCETIIDRRLIPGEDEQKALQEIEQVIQKAALDKYVRIDRLIPTTGGASEISAEHPMVKLASASIEKVYGQKPELIGLTANCDMSHFMKREIPTVIYGPGDFSQAHKVDEWVSLSELEKAAWVYATMVLNVAG